MPINASEGKILEMNDPQAKERTVRQQDSSRVKGANLHTESQPSQEYMIIGSLVKKDIFQQHNCFSKFSKHRE